MALTRKRTISDEATKKATGKTLAQWFAVLDRNGAKKMKHPDIAKLLLHIYKVSAWWSQMVTVEYEYAHGLRTKTLPRMHPEFRKALSANVKAAQAFATIPPSHKREYLEYIAEAKKPETRERRIKRSIEMLHGWKKSESKK